MIFIPFNVPSSKNSRRWTGKYFIESEACTLWKKLTKTHWEEGKESFWRDVRPRVIGFHFIRKSRHKFDFINPMQTIQDMMKDYGWIDDDNMDELIPIPVPVSGKWYTYDKDNPGVFIFTEDELKEKFGMNAITV